MVYRLRTGHSRLRSHMKKTGIEESALYPCVLDAQTTSHVLQSCPLHKEERESTWATESSTGNKLHGTAIDLRLTLLFIKYDRPYRTLKKKIAVRVIVLLNCKLGNLESVNLTADHEHSMASYCWSVMCSFSLIIVTSTIQVRSVNMPCLLTVFCFEIQWLTFMCSPRAVEFEFCVLVEFPRSLTPNRMLHSLRHEWRFFYSYLHCNVTVLLLAFLAVNPNDPAYLLWNQVYIIYHKSDCVACVFFPL